MLVTSQERSTLIADTLAVIHEVTWEWRHIAARKLTEAGGTLMVAGVLCQEAARRLRKD